MSDPADATNTTPLQQINWGGEGGHDSLWEKVKRAREVAKAKKNKIEVHIHVHHHGDD